MRLALNPARGLSGRGRGVDPYLLLEVALIGLLAVQGVRLAWALAAPLPAVEASAAAPNAPAPAALKGFDPFYRMSGGGSAPVVVTSLNLQLFGVRQDEASGRGSAIIATPDGQQRSFAVGDEIAPGVTLKAVAFDSVTISRGGSDEQLFMDQSGEPEVVIPAAPAPAAAAPAAGPTAAAPASPKVLPAGDPAADIRFQPRIAGKTLTGVAVQPRGSGEAFRALGLMPGDVLVRVNGRRIQSPDQLRGLAAELSGPRVTLQVERAGRVQTVRPGGAR